MLTVYHNARIFSSLEYRRDLETAMFSNQVITIDRADLRPVAQMNESPKSLADVQNVLSYACARTQHDTRAWWEHPDITRLGDGEHRSTSVGDVIEINGKFWLVADIGFRECIVMENNKAEPA
ncbi:MAG: hypothetical protein KME43_21325 [Myxacorys chilensis ATA2-1-KO14]|jgi:hypothetical protein|nr:hypothetical protein [Myxacorys chilensis ATA2-1-KO14]